MTDIIIESELDTNQRECRVVLHCFAISPIPFIIFSSSVQTFISFYYQYIVGTPYIFLPSGYDINFPLTLPLNVIALIRQCAWV